MPVGRDIASNVVVYLTRGRYQLRAVPGPGGRISDRGHLSFSIVRVGAVHVEGLGGLLVRVVDVVVELLLDLEALAGTLAGLGIGVHFGEGDLAGDGVVAAAVAGDVAVGGETG